MRGVAQQLSERPTLENAPYRPSRSCTRMQQLAIDFSVSAASEILAGPPLLAYFCLFLIVEVAIVYFVFRISHAIYDLGPAVVCALLAFAPCLGSLTVLVLNGTVMDYLRKNDIKVGFMGATRLQIEDLRNDIHAQPPPAP